MRRIRKKCSQGFMCRNATKNLQTTKKSLHTPINSWWRLRKSKAWWVTTITTIVKVSTFDKDMPMVHNRCLTMAIKSCSTYQRRVKISSVKIIGKMMGKWKTRLMVFKKAIQARIWSKRQISETLSGGTMNRLLALLTPEAHPHDSLIYFFLIWINV